MRGLNDEVITKSRTKDEINFNDDWKIPISFDESRHKESIQGIDWQLEQWRLKEKMKTVSVALVLCLNVGVDPPDVIKTQPSARLESWIDPASMSPQKAIEAIGESLQKQYEMWQPRARYKLSLDPTIEEIKKLCTSLRRNAKDERVLFHYNGHGVPKPTKNGEIWVFNRSYTQYIPLSIYDLQSWMGAPSIYVYDCSNAGTIIDSFKQFAEQHEKEFQLHDKLIVTQNSPQKQQKLCSTTTAASISHSTSQKLGVSGGSGSMALPPSFKNCIQLGACSKNETLPMSPELPADLFTSCLTTPLKVALKWFVKNHHLQNITEDLIERIPGKITERHTMLGELNWIFTAITDTIAWNTFPKDLFQKLFRQDLLVASLFRNYLLAERVLRSYDCTPVSSPQLATTHKHHLWTAWDYVLELALAQLPDILFNHKPYTNSTFFEDHLTAFEVWLQYGYEKEIGVVCAGEGGPEQLPIVLQVLLSQVHRTRALELLSRFLDLGPWAVTLALNVGIYPYVLKLLQSKAQEVKPMLVFIWAKILAIDPTCQVDLIRENAHLYFLSILQTPTFDIIYRSLAAFSLSCLVCNYEQGQKTTMQSSLVSICLEQLSNINTNSPPQQQQQQLIGVVDLNCLCTKNNRSSAMQQWRFKQWLILCLARLWQNYGEARWCAVRDRAPDKLYDFLCDPSPEVRAAAVYALGTFISSVKERSEHANKIDQQIAMTLLKMCGDDMSWLVRRELVAGPLFAITHLFEPAFVTVANWHQNKKLGGGGELREAPEMVNNNVTKTTTKQNQQQRLKLLTKEKQNDCFVEQNNVMSKIHASTTILKRVASSSSINSFGGASIRVGAQSNVDSSATTQTTTIATTFNTPTSLSYGSVFMKLWQAIVAYDYDPHPGVSKIANQITTFIQYLATKENSFDLERGSISLPPSPNRTSYLGGGESPPHQIIHSSTLLHSSPIDQYHHRRNNILMTNRNRGGSSAGATSNTLQRYQTNSPSSNTIAEEAMIASDETCSWKSNSRASPSRTTATQKNSSHDSLYDNIETDYVKWSSKYIAQSIMAHNCHALRHHRRDLNGEDEGVLNFNSDIALKISIDIECDEYLERNQRFIRNERVRKQGLIEEIELLEDDGNNCIDSPAVFSIKCNSHLTPSVIKFHPYQSHILVAHKDTFSIYNWQSNLKLCKWQQHQATAIAQPNICSLEYVNSHDISLIMCATTDGTIRVWRPKLTSGGSDIPKKFHLVSAWQAFDYGCSIDYQSTHTNAKLNSAIRDGGGVLMKWEQDNQKCIVTSESFTSQQQRVIRLWDAASERRSQDIAIQSESTITSFDTDDRHLICAGFVDGTIRIYDRRCLNGPNRTLQTTYRDHLSSILNVCFFQNGNKISTASLNGDIRIYNNADSLNYATHQLNQPIISQATHKSADLYACGVSNEPYINLYHISNQKKLNQIKLNEMSSSLTNSSSTSSTTSSTSFIQSLPRHLSYHYPTATTTLTNSCMTSLVMHPVRVALASVSTQSESSSLLQVFKMQPKPR